MSKGMRILDWILRIVAALILFQTLYFKFSGAEESVFIFSELGMDPEGRIGSGIAELIAGILLLIPRTAVYGAIMAIGVISGAIFFHLTKLGIEVRGDGGQLFYYALAVLIASAISLWIHRREIPFIGKMFGK